MSSWAVTDAVLLAARSDVMLGVAVAAVGATSIVGTTLRRRALVLGLTWGESVVAAAHDEARAVAAGWRLRTPHPGRADEPTGDPDGDLSRVRLAATLAAAAALGLIGAGVLAWSGHPPAPVATVLLAAVLAAVAVRVAVLACRPAPTRAILARRGARLMASSLFVEISAATAMVVAVVVVSHTEGLSAVSLVEVAAITATTRLVLSLTPWPGGLGVADAVLLLPLMWVGLPLDVALAAVLVWRAGSLLAALAAIIVARRTEPATPQAAGPAGTDGGRLLHRALFTGLSLLPQWMRDRARRHVFDALFSLSDDPWGYQATAYEQRKRAHLLAAVPLGAHTIVEVGCADGHNLVQLAHRSPGARIWGTDVSTGAVAIARTRTAGLGNVQVMTSEEFASPHAAVDPIDCVILAEVLYYLGTEAAMRRSLRPVRDRMSPDCVVVLLHGCADAPLLHSRAVRALGVPVAAEQRIADPERAYLITVARATP